MQAWAVILIVLVILCSASSVASVVLYYVSPLLRAAVPTDASTPKDRRDVLPK